MVARTPFLYALVPRIMSFSVWPITRRQSRVPTLADTPVGRLLASGRWVASSRITPSARPSLMIFSASSPASWPYSGWVNSSWHSSIATTSGCKPSSGRLANLGVTLFSGQTVLGSPPDGVSTLRPHLAGHLSGGDTGPAAALARPEPGEGGVGESAGRWAQAPASPI